ncbi:MAG: sporulation transcriptional regulator SpoIIID [Eubacteriales bacterium]|nr:sporulation transcriptional regulator SpoIIID [Eubacteriales bacterium]
MDYFYERMVMLGEYIASSGATVRQAAKRFGISKSTVHKDITFRLPRECPALYEQVRIILDRNKAQRHMRGGEATREKYKRIKQAHSLSKKENEERKI